MDHSSLTPWGDLTLTAMRFNPICKAFAERLKEQGKPQIVIIGAIMNTRYAHAMLWKLIRFQFTGFSSIKNHSILNT